jgi:hypothetical protein
VRPIDDRVPEAIGPLENQSKDGAQKAGRPTHRKRQEREDKQAAVFRYVPWAAVLFLSSFH